MVEQRLIDANAEAAWAWRDERRPRPRDGGKGCSST